jgi:hypothetical protein
MHACVLTWWILIKDMSSLYDHSLSTWVLSFLLGSFYLVAITSSGLQIIYNHDDNDDDTTPVLSMFMRYALLIQDHMFNRNMENHRGKQCNHNTIWLWSWLIY